MGFKVYGKEFEGVAAAELFSDITGSDIIDRMRYLKTYLENGGTVHIEFTKGARTGTIGRLNIKPEDCVGLYREITGGLYKGYQMITSSDWELVFDDRPQTVKLKVERRKPMPGVLRFGVETTKWVYTTNEREKPNPLQLKDHFGVVLEPEQVVMFMHGKGNDYEVRFGKIKRISDKGTIWIEAFKTRDHHEVEECCHGIQAKNVFVMDGDLKNKAMIAKLSQN